ncbi:hypothetical protein C1G86_0369 [Dehalococcoides mccartyi]|uniref:Diacylglycerol kinase n=1 Tax=Dehalococcoides mccartyi TaxID=61435 RepID=A0A142V8M7_9CHLR|nr:diacylglycerol kinase [Dehalococcoides mccartyi]RAL69429.1 hypothetical protein C1G87_0386 [Dehalococcoides mccartyi]RAL70737.1 hypothetical protein C1G86_0369 [Dehalococcoides mccartyi]
MDLAPATGLTITFATKYFNSHWYILIVTLPYRFYYSEILTTFYTS